MQILSKRSMVLGVFCLIAELAQLVAAFPADSSGGFAPDGMQTP
jgi:hypothetical protein